MIDIFSVKVNLIDSVNEYFVDDDFEDYESPVTSIKVDPNGRYADVCIEGYRTKRFFNIIMCSFDMRGAYLEDIKKPK